MSSKVYYTTESLLSEEEKDHSLEFALPDRFKDVSLTRKFLRRFSVVVPWVLLLALFSWNWFQYQRRGPKSIIFPQLTYSPVQNILEYEVRKFELGFNDETTEYQGYPSPEIDQKWNDLYMMGISHIPKTQAAKLVNSTAMLPSRNSENNEREYIIELDVFHQLHCLNMIRKALSPEYYPQTMPGPDGEDELLGFHHINHCVDAIRQSLMCTVDVTPLVWQWSEEREMLVEKATVLHTCRNFESVKQWAAERMVRHDFDVKHREMNDPLDPKTWENGFQGK